MAEPELLNEMDSKDVFTLYELAERLGKPYSTLYDSAKRGQIPTVRIGRALLVPRHAYELWLKGEWEPKVKPARRK